MNFFMKRLLFLAIVLLGTMNVMAQIEYGRVSEKETKTYCQAEFRSNQHTDDGYWYIYDFHFINDGGDHKLRLYNPSDGSRFYKILRCAGSLIRKEFWLKDMDSGEAVSLVIKVEEGADARNTMEYHVYMDKYPGKLANQKKIHAIIGSEYNIKNSAFYGRFLFGKTVANNTEWKAGGITDFFNYISSQFED